MSNLVKHAEYEMKRAGLYDKDSDYDGMIPETVTAMVRAFAGRGHSGGSHGLVMSVLNKVMHFKTLTPLTNDPDEWFDISDNCGGDPVWQNKRDSSYFSKDGGKNWHSVDDKQEGDRL